MRATLSTQGLISMGARIFQVAAMFLANILLARALGADGYGAFSTVLAVAVLLSMPISQGLPTVVVKEVAQNVAKGALDKVAGIWTAATNWIGAYGFLLGSLFVVLVWIEIPGITGSKSLLVLGLVLANGLGRLRNAILGGFGYPVVAQITELMVRPLLFILVVLWFPFHVFPPADAGLFAYLFASVVAVLVGFIAIDWLVDAQRLERSKNFGSARVLASAAPLALVAGIQTIMGQVEIIVLSIVGSEPDVAHFKVALQAASLVGLGTAAFNAVLDPKIAAKFSQMDVSSVQNLSREAARFTSILALVVLLPLIAFGDEAINFAFGPEFAGAYWPMVILSVGQLLVALCGPVGVVLKMSGSEKALVPIMLVSLSTGVVLTTSMATFWGPVGAAIGSIGALSISRLLMARAAKSRVGIGLGAF